MKTPFTALPAFGRIPFLNLGLAVTPKTNQPIWPRLVRFSLLLVLLLLGEPLEAASIIQFSAYTYNVNEDTNQIEIAIQRTNDLDTIVSVDLATTNLTATAGADYLDVSIQSIFLAGETNRIVAVPILNDGLVEAIETFQVLLSNPTGGAELGARSNAAVRITSNDKGLQVEFARYQAREDEGSVLIGLVRGDDGDFPATVEYATADGTALAGQDYTSTSGKLEFATGEKLKLFTIPILNDGLKEASETFRLYLTNVTGTVLGSPTATTITILDNDPGVQFEFNTYRVQESEGALTARVLRGNDVDLSPFTVEYATTNVTAVAGEDYTETKGMLAFAEGETVKVLTLPITDDQAAESDEKFTVTLANATGSAVLGRIITATVTILDATGMAPHRFEDLTVLEDRRVQLTLGGGVSKRFMDYFDLYPVEVSENLVDWAPLVTLQRTNSSTNAFTYTDSQAGTSSMRFYRTVTNHLITPVRNPTGPCAVGVISRLLTDPTRRNRYGISTNSSFMSSIWYPAVQEPGRTRSVFIERQMAQDPALMGNFTDRIPYFVGHALADAPCATNPTPHPIVLYSHPLGGERNDITEMAENLASHGYVVVSVDHLDAEGTVFPDGMYLHGDASTLSNAGFQDQVRDLLFVLGELARWNDTDPAFEGRLGLNRVAAMGMSWGGGVAGELGRIDDRVKAVVLLDAYLQNADDLVRLGLSKPFLGMYSTEVGGDTRLFNMATRDAVWFQISSTGHANFHDWYWWSYPNSVEAGREAARTINAYTLWFLNKHLKDRPDPMPVRNEYPRVINFRQK